jgi:hypothetical protein
MSRQFITYKPEFGVQKNRTSSDRLEAKYNLTLLEHFYKLKQPGDY